MGEQLYGRVLTVARWIGSLLPLKATIMVALEAGTYRLL